MTNWEQRPPDLEPEELFAWALTTIADELHGIHMALNALGTGDAATTMGAIEFLAKEVRDGFATVAAAIEVNALADPPH